MDQPLTLDQLFGLGVALVVIASALAGAWWFLFANILAVRRELNEFRLKVVEDYASREHLKEVEIRLVDAINKLSDKFEALPSKIAAAMHPPKD